MRVIKCPQCGSKNNFYVKFSTITDASLEIISIPRYLCCKCNTIAIDTYIKKINTNIKIL